MESIASGYKAVTSFVVSERKCDEILISFSITYLWGSKMLENKCTIKFFILNTWALPTLHS